MKVLPADKSSIPLAIEALARREVILIPTETVYGLAADSESDGATGLLRALKGVEGEKLFQRLAAGIEDVRSASPCWSERIERLAGRFWPGPLTLVLDGVGWRVPRHDFVQALIRRLGRPLVATSANLAGEKPALSCEEAVKIFGEKIGLALDGGRGCSGRASSVARVAGPSLEILREEAISGREILNVWNEK